jgi:hypothetical protein
VLVAAEKLAATRICWTTYMCLFIASDMRLSEHDRASSLPIDRRQKQRQQ